MSRVFTYYNRLQTTRSTFSNLPAYARFILLIFALPGILLAALSILLLLVSILALLLLTVPVYVLLKAVFGTPEFSAHEGTFAGGVQVTDLRPPDEDPDRPRRQIDVTIIE